MKAVLRSSVLILVTGFVLAAVAAQAGQAKSHRSGKRGDGRCRSARAAASGKPDAASERAAKCRDMQREVQRAVAEAGADARNRGQLMKTINRTLSRFPEKGLGECRGCITDQFARGVTVGEQRPCGLHDRCVEGDALERAADPCVALVCDIRKRCCRRRWDTVCVAIASNICEPACEQCLHDACVEGRALADQCTDCTFLVCGQDPYCCDTSWDAACVERALGTCTLTCGTSTTSTTPTTTTTTTSTTSTTSTTTTTVPECRNDDDCENGDACTVDTCSSRHCVSTVRSCDDRDACTNDSCDPASGCRSTPIACEDSNPCTTDGCSSGACTHTANTGSCDDGNPCTLSDHCAASACVGTPRVCNDGNGCTSDFCDATGACRSVTNANSCDDGNACTIGDRCLAGGCVGGPLLNCDDNNRCTVDFCDSTGTCRHNTPGCSDGNACTLDFCDPALGCGHQTASCDDGDPCTTDTCDTISGCRHARVTGCVP